MINENHLSDQFKTSDQDSRSRLAIKTSNQEMTCLIVSPRASLACPDLSKAFAIIFLRDDLFVPQ